ncbi:hypothetical protein SLE2022_141290 [Rubroshorea leprosula]
MVGGLILRNGARFVDELTEMTEAWFVLELTASGTEVTPWTLRVLDTENPEEKGLGFKQINRTIYLP